MKGCVDGRHEGVAPVHGQGEEGRDRLVPVEDEPGHRRGDGDPPRNAEERGPL